MHNLTSRHFRVPHIEVGERSHVGKRVVKGRKTAADVGPHKAEKVQTLEVPPLRVMFENERRSPRFVHVGDVAAKPRVGCHAQVLHVETE